MNIPVLYYHSLSNSNNRVWGFLSIPTNTFKLQVRLLKFLGYYTCNWDELYEHVNGRKKLPSKTVMLQFDDGFLDNWSVVFPILKKYDIQVTVVVSEDFVEKNNRIRPFVSETNNKNIDDWWGYLSEGELRELEKSGLVDIQAHGKTHTWYESEPVLEDIYDGTQLLPHLYWNNNVQEKVNWLSTRLEDAIPMGYPIFSYKKSLELNKRYLINDDFFEESLAVYDITKGKEFNLNSVKTVMKERQEAGTLGRYETEIEKQSRLEEELLGNKNYLEKVLNKKVEYLVYPGGGKMEEVIELSKNYGYKLVSQGNELNGFNSGVFRVSRVSATYPFKVKGLYSALNLVFFYFQIKRAQGGKVIGLISNSMKKVLGYA